MRGRRTPLAGLACALVLGLTGCGPFGGEPGEDYCASLQESRKQLAEMVSADAGPAALLEQLPLLRDLAEEAPRDLTDEWQTFLNAVENLEKAMRRAQVDPEDFEGGKPPAGTDAEDLRQIQDAATQLTSPDVAEAAGGIEQQARDVCKVNFGL